MLNDRRKIEILSEIKKYPSIIEVFGNQFITDSINSYKTIDTIKWSPQNYFISNYFMHISHYPNQINFVRELESMLNYFLANHSTYIKSKYVLTRLKSKDESLFQGKWSELIFIYFLKKRDIEIIDICAIQNSIDGEKELYDIKTSCGEIEVTAIISDNGKIFDTEGVFGGTIEIGEIEKGFVNKKIKKKHGKKILAIDCTMVDGLYQRLHESSIGFKVDFDVFKKTSKNILLFLRDSTTQQVLLSKYIKGTV